MRIKNNKSTTKNIPMLLLFQDSVIVFAEYECFKMFFESGQCWCFSDIGWKFIPEPRSGDSERTFTKFKSCAWNNELTMFTEIYSCLRLWTRDIIDEAVRLVLYVDITYAQVKFYCILYISVISVDIVFANDYSVKCLFCCRCRMWWYWWVILIQDLR